VFQWNLRYPPAYDPPGFRTVPTDDWPDAGDGPTIVPGDYTVALQYGTTKLQAPLKLQLDPRVHPAAGELDARLALEMQIRDTIDGLDRAIAAAMVARPHVVPTKRAQIDSEIGKLIQFNIHSTEADTSYEDLLRAQLGFLLNSLEGAYQAPTAAEYATFDTLKGLAAAGEARLQALTR
ncbi:MAG TPA: hypothetical protein VNG31_02000, partial [Candidatus Baltobacteraceae bacterium]|nr:hypothetical protein [Candidatus Baltobacteraceae bacterium]